MINTRSLGEVAEIVRGISFPKEAKSTKPRSGDIACLRTTNVQQQVDWDDLWFVPVEHVKRDDQYVRQGDILISTANSYELVGKVAFVSSPPRPATLGAFISLIRPRGGVDPKFLYHQLAWSKTQSRIRGTASTTTNISNVSTKKLAALDLQIPPLEGQRRIVAQIEKQFSRLDETIVNLQRVKAHLRRYKDAVLKAAVEGRLELSEVELARRENRTCETSTELLQRILEMRRSLNNRKGKYKETGEPDLAVLNVAPEGWTWARLDALCTDIVDCPHSTPRFVEAGQFCIDTTWMSEDGFRLEKARFVSEETYRERTKRLVPKPGDIVFAREGTIGTAVAIPIGMEACLGQRVMLLRPAADVASSYLRTALASPLVRRQYLPKVLGSTAPHVNVAEVKAFAIPLPPYAEQLRIVAEVERSLSVAREVERQVNANLVGADRMRQAVLVEAYSTKEDRETIRAGEGAGHA